MKILIFGASGSGTTTVGKSLAEILDYIHMEVDDYYY
jgi:adenylate kinase family enzyme